MFVHIAGNFVECVPGLLSICCLRANVTKNGHLNAMHVFFGGSVYAFNQRTLIEYGAFRVLK